MFCELLLLVVSIIALIAWYIGISSEDRLFKKIPGPWKLPLIGCVHHLPSDINDFQTAITKLGQKYKDYPFFSFYLGFDRILIITQADIAEEVFTTADFNQKSDRYNFLKPWLGTGLLISHGEKWKQRRKLITPAFHFSILKSFLDIFNDNAKIFTKVLSRYADSEISFEFSKEISLCTLDIIVETAMGTQINAQLGGESSYVEAVHDVTKIIRQRMASFIYNIDFIFHRLPIGKRYGNYLKTLHDFTGKVITDRYDCLKKNKSCSLNDKTPMKKTAFLDLLLNTMEETGKIDLDGIQEEVDTFMFEGHDTTSSAITWIIFMIGSHPDVQEKLQKEIDDVMGDKEYIAYEDLHELEYMSCVIKETFRLYPPVPGFARKLKENFNLAGYTIPRNTSIWILAMSLHRNENYFSNPEKFDPNRFLPENSLDRNPFSYVPFSAGFRNCIGQRFAIMSIKIILSHLISKYHITCCQEMSEVKYVNRFTLKPENGIWISISKRTDNY